MLTADEARQLMRQAPREPSGRGRGGAGLRLLRLAFARRRIVLGGEDRAIQARGLRIGLGLELLAQHAAQLLVLRERLLAAPGGCEQPHQSAMG